MSSFLDKTPFFKLFVALALAVVAYRMFGFCGWWLLLFAGVGLGLMVAITGLHNAAQLYRYNFLFGMGTLLVLFAMGQYLAEWQQQRDVFSHTGRSGIYTVELMDYPTIKERSVAMDVYVKTFSDSTRSEHASGKAILYLARDSAAMTLNCGDVLLVSTKFDSPALRGNPDEFDYGNYLALHGFGATSYVRAGEWQKANLKTPFRLRTIAAKCRAYLLDIYRDMQIDGNEFGVVASLTLGYRDALTPELKETFANTGAMHVLAVSGLHIGIIFVIFNTIFSFLDKNHHTRRLKSLLAILFLWLYVFITGLPPSACRAAVMYSFIAAGDCIERKPYIYNSIFASAFLLAAVRPMLIYDLSFQLSYSAVLAIVYFQPKLSALFTFKQRWMRYPWDLATVSLAAQIGTFPWALYYFHQFSNWFLLSNYIVIPAATVILYLAALLFALSSVPYVGVAVAWGLKTTLTWMCKGISAIESLHYSLTIIWIDIWQLLLLFVSIFSFGLWLNRRTFKVMCTGLVALLCALCIGVFHNMENAQKSQLTLFNHSEHVIANVVEPKKNSVYTTDSDEAQRLGRDFWEHNQSVAPTFVPPDTVGIGTPFVFDGESYLMLTRYPFQNKVAPLPLEVNHLVVSRAIFPRKELFENYIHPKQLIIMANVSKKNTEKFIHLADSLEIEHFSIREQGAYVRHKKSR